MNGLRTTLPGGFDLFEFAREITLDHARALAYGGPVGVLTVPPEDVAPSGFRVPQPSLSVEPQANGWASGEGNESDPGAARLLRVFSLSPPRSPSACS